MTPSRTTSATNVSTHESCPWRLADHHLFFRLTCPMTANPTSPMSDFASISFNHAFASFQAAVWSTTTRRVFQTDCFRHRWKRRSTCLSKVTTQSILEIDPGFHPRRVSNPKEKMPRKIQVQTRRFVVECLPTVLVGHHARSSMALSKDVVACFRCGRTMDGEMLGVRSRGPQRCPLTQGRMRMRMLAEKVHGRPPNSVQHIIVETKSPRQQSAYTLLSTTLDASTNDDRRRASVHGNGKGGLSIHETRLPT